MNLSLISSFMKVVSYVFSFSSLVFHQTTIHTWAFWTSFILHRWKRRKLRNPFDSYLRQTPYMSNELFLNNLWPFKFLLLLHLQVPWNSMSFKLLILLLLLSLVFSSWEQPFKLSFYFFLRVNCQNLKKQIVSLYLQAIFQSS